MANRRQSARLLTDLVALPPHTGGFTLELLDLAHIWSVRGDNDIDLSDILALTSSVIRSWSFLIAPQEDGECTKTSPPNISILLDGKWCRWIEKVVTFVHTKVKKKGPRVSFFLQTVADQQRYCLTSLNDHEDPQRVQVARTNQHIHRHVKSDRRAGSHVRCHGELESCPEPSHHLAPEPSLEPSKDLPAPFCSLRCRGLPHSSSRCSLLFNV